MQNRFDFISDNLKKIRSRIAAAAQRSGRQAEDISLLAVTKNVSVADIRLLMETGIQLVGENKVQEAKRKFSQIGPALNWHMLGHLQTNKARDAAAIFDTVQSIDSPRIAESLNRAVNAFDREVDVLIEINIGGEEQKFGVPPEQAADLADFVARCEHLRLRGLMAMAPYVSDPELIRPLFRRLRHLFLELGERLPASERWTVLSMGMTNDFEVAIEEGSTLVRIGTGIFAPPAGGN